MGSFSQGVKESTRGVVSTTPKVYFRGPKDVGVESGKGRGEIRKGRYETVDVTGFGFVRDRRYRHV